MSTPDGSGRYVVGVDLGGEETRVADLTVAEVVSLAGAGLVTYTWLSASTSYAGSDTYTSWTIRQSATTTACNMSLDPDEASDLKYGGFTVAAT